jgi:hypothetical protein
METYLKRTDTTLDLSQKAKRAGEKRKEEEKQWAMAGFIYAKVGTAHFQGVQESSFVLVDLASVDL